MFNKVSCISTRWFLISASQSHAALVIVVVALDVVVVVVEGSVEEAGVVSDMDEVNKLTRDIVLDELVVV